MKRWLLRVVVLPALRLEVVSHNWSMVWRVGLEI